MSTNKYSKSIWIQSQTFQQSNIQKNLNTELNIRMNSDTESDTQMNANTESDIQTNSNTESDIQMNENTESDIQINENTESGIQMNENTESNEFKYLIKWIWILNCLSKQNLTTFMHQYRIARESDESSSCRPPTKSLVNTSLKLQIFVLNGISMLHDVIFRQTTLKIARNVIVIHSTSL